MHDGDPQSGSREFPFPPVLVRTHEEAVNELLKPCGRFNSTLSFSDRIRAHLSQWSHRSAAGTTKILTSGGIPLNWQHLLEYLHKNKVIASPRFLSRPLPDVHPALLNLQLELDLGSRHTDGRDSRISAFGGSFSREIAMSKAVGEGLERYFFSMYTHKKMIFRSQDELRSAGIHSLDIRELNSFLPWQKVLFPQFGHETDKPLHWVNGEELTTGRPILLPAQLIFWNYLHEGTRGKEDEQVLAHITTSGAAGHFSKQEALLGALLENIQRDGFFMYWLNGLSPHVIDVSESTDPDLVEMLDYLARRDKKALFLDTTTDVGIPSCVCVVTSMHEGEPVISLGGGCGFDLKGTLVQSAIEASVVNDSVPYIPRSSLPENYRPFTDLYFGRPERLALWRGTTMEKRIAFFTRGTRRSVEDFIGSVEHLHTTNEQLAYTCDRLQALGAGYEVYVYEVHDHILKKLGYHVVRAIVPQLFPLYLFEHAPLLHSKRLREVPTRLGFKAADVPTPWPHPFP